MAARCGSAGTGKSKDAGGMSALELQQEQWLPVPAKRKSEIIEIVLPLLALQHCFFTFGEPQWEEGSKHQDKLWQCSAPRHLQARELARREHEGLESPSAINRWVTAYSICGATVGTLLFEENYWLNLTPRSQ